ncbi:MAG: hypothetical protein V4510_08830 [bacterium]
MSLRLLSAAALFFALFAGCAQTETTTTTTDDHAAAVNLLAGPALWADPQNAPHAKWGWPTLSNPAIGPLPSTPDGCMARTARNATTPYTTGCLAWWNPINGTALPAHVTGMQHLLQVGGNVTQGAGIALFGRIAVVPEDGSQAHFVDISDPTHPVPLSAIDTGGRGAAIIAYPNGRLVTVISTSPGFDVIDFTDPVHPVQLADVSPSEGGHKLGVVPGTPIVYNAGSNGGEASSPINPLGLGPGTCSASITNCVGYTSIYNLTDPEHPKLVQEFKNGLSCHHIFFWNNATQNKFRAICAGIQYTQLWDTTDPEHPKVIVSIPVHSGVANGPSNSASVEMFSHSAGMNIKGDVLYVGDESGGGGLPPGCAASAAVPLDGSSAGTPIGATWFYDVSNEASPQVLGYFEPPVQPTTYAGTDGQIHSASCTTHHGRMVPDMEGRDLLAMSYYGDGVILLDFTNVGPGVVPKMISQYQDHSNTWETAYDNGYLFTGDLSRGMDVLKLI